MIWMIVSAWLLTIAIIAAGILIVNAVFRLWGKSNEPDDY